MTTTRRIRTIATLLFAACCLLAASCGTIEDRALEGLDDLKGDASGNTTNTPSDNPGGGADSVPSVPTTPTTTNPEPTTPTTTDPETTPKPTDPVSTLPPDSDGDGVTDDQDTCPGTVSGIEVDGGGCSSGQIDNDGDDWPLSQDCDDSNASVNPGVTEIPDNGTDDNCVDGDAVTCPVRTVQVNQLPIRTWAENISNGDKEFGGNTVFVSAEIASTWDEKRLNLILSMIAKEAGGDQSIGYGDSGLYQVFTAGNDERILSVQAGGQAIPRDGVVTKIETTDDSHGAHNIATDGLVSNWRIVADTEDNDIGNNKGDSDANVTASLRLIEVEIESQVGACVRR